MEKKKFVLVILLAAILALVLSVLFSPKPSKNIIKNNEAIIEETINSQKETLDIETFSNQEQQNESNIKEEAPKIKTVNPETTKSVAKDTQNKDSKIDKNISSDIKLDTGIIKTSNTNEIIITREFRTKTPVKYTFVGYGEQLAPTR